MSILNVLELLNEGKRVRAEFEKAKSTYIDGLKPVEAGIKAFVIQYYGLFRPLVLQANKHRCYQIPEVRKYELDDENAVDIGRDFYDFSFTDSEEGFCCFSGYTKLTHCEQTQEEFSISILPKYLGENGVSIMQQDAARIKAELDTMDAEYERQKKMEKEADDRAQYEALSRRFGGQSASISAGGDAI